MLKIAGRVFNGSKIVKFLCYCLIYGLILSPNLWAAAPIFPAKKDHVDTCCLSPSIELSNSLLEGTFLSKTIPENIDMLISRTIEIKNFDFNRAQDYIKDISLGNKSKLINNLILLDSEKRQEVVYGLFAQITSDPKYKDRELFIDKSIIDSSRKFMSIASQAIELLEQMNKNQDIKTIYRDLRKMGLLFMWGNSREKIIANLKNIIILGSENPEASELKSSLKQILINLLIFPYYRHLPSKANSVQLEQLSGLNYAQRSNVLFGFILEISLKHKSKNLFFDTQQIKSLNQFKKLISRSENFLSDSDENLSVAQLYAGLEALGIRRGWGKSKALIMKSFESVKTVMSENSTKQEVSDALKYIEEHFPLTWNIVHYSPHGCFNQNGILGAPDTGGQVIYIVDLIRETVADLKMRNKNAGILPEDNHPQILVLTRLIKKRPVEINEQDWAQIKSFEEKEEIEDTQGDAFILRVPVAGDEFMDRFSLIQYIPEFVKNSKLVLENFKSSHYFGSDLSHEIDMVFGHYTDGGLAGLTLSLLTKSPFFWVLHASENSKERGIMNTADLELQMYLDMLMSITGRVIVSSEHEKNIQHPEISGGFLLKDERYLAMLNFLGKTKMQVDPLGVSADYALEDPLNVMRVLIDSFPGQVQVEDEKKSLEYNVMVNVMNSFIELRNNSPEDKQIRLNLLLGKIYKKLLSGRVIDNYPEFKQMLSSRENVEFIKNLEADTQGYNPDNSINVSMAMSRIDDVKNARLLVEMYTGGTIFTNKIAEIIKAKVNLAQSWGRFTDSLRKGFLPNELFVPEFIDLMPEDIKAKLIKLKKMRANNISFIIGGAENSAKTMDAKGNMTEQGKLLFWIEQTIQKSGLEDTVVHLKALNGVPVFRIFKLMDAVFIQPAKEESYGLTIIEAMKAGLISVITQNAGAIDILGDNPGLTEFLFDPYSVDALIAQIDKINNMNEQEKEFYRNEFEVEYAKSGGWEKKWLAIRSLSELGQMIDVHMKINNNTDVFDERLNIVKNFINDFSQEDTLFSNLLKKVNRLLETSPELVLPSVQEPKPQQVNHFINQAI